MTSRDLKGETRDIYTLRANVSKTAGNRDSVTKDH